MPHPCDDSCQFYIVFAPGRKKQRRCYIYTVGEDMLGELIKTALVCRIGIVQIKFPALLRVVDSLERSAVVIYLKRGSFDLVQCRD